MQVGLKMLEMCNYSICLHNTDTHKQYIYNIYPKESRRNLVSFSIQKNQEEIW